MGYSFNSNVLVTNLPPIPQALVWTKNYDGKETLINLSQGSPGVPPPHEFLSRIAESVMEPDSTKYGDVRGEMGLREAISKDMREYYCCGQIKFENISIAAGCNMAFLTTVMVLAAPGDELIVPEPFYFNHE